MTPWDWAALAVFVVCWFGYERFIRRLSHRSGALVTDMTVVRRAWMRAMVTRELRLMDSQLLGHTINSASFFGSANLILIAAVAGALFGGEALRSGLELGLVARETPPVLFEAKLALVIVCLARGFLNFIWSIRQLNYTLALMGAAPENLGPARADAFADAAADVLNPALSAFNQGVRGYYFALSAAAWLFGPLYFLVATLGAVGLLGWRQSRSRAALGVRRVRHLLEIDGNVKLTTTSNALRRCSNRTPTVTSLS